MNKTEYQKEKNLNRKLFPYEPKDEAEARAIADIAMKYNISEPDEALGSNYVISQFLEEKYGKKFELEQQELRLEEALKKKERLREFYGDLSEESLNELNRVRDGLNLKESLKQELGIVQDKEAGKKTMLEKLKKYASFLKGKDEEKEIKKQVDEEWEAGGKEEAEKMIKEALAELKEKLASPDLDIETGQKGNSSTPF